MVLPLLLIAGMMDSAAVAVDTTQVGESPGATVDTLQVEASPFAFSAIVTGYFGSFDAYLVPDLWFEFHGLHLEGRYNYEDLHTGSFFMGWHFGGGDAGTGLDVTPMAGWITGRTEGSAPALLLDVRLRPFELYNEFEYVFPKDGSSFAYDHSELICKLSAGVFMGVVGEHTLDPTDRKFIPGILIGGGGSRLGVTFSLFPRQDDARGALDLELKY